MRSAYIVNDNGKLEPNEKYLALNHTVKGQQKRNPSTKWDEEKWNENILKKEKKRGSYTEEALDKYRRMMQEPRPEEEKESRRTRKKRMKDIKQFQMILDSLGLQYN